jgi:probable rRNA maturation factor
VIEVIVEDPAWTAAEPAVALLVRAAVAATLDDEGVGEDAEVAVLLTSDDAVRRLNTEFRGKDDATNVLAFPAAKGAETLGDVALAFGVCAREAGEQGKSLARHLQHLATHGVLHLLGYDHVTDSEAEAMEARERDILRGLGVPDPYEDHGQPGR